ncbi:hypothetical protein C1I99_14220 [Micromonospora deserti]|uniref:Uncharacterized protein n=1 Tax=Micromonospora deserti TaxID=2070366 RepID=A0A2W2DLV2_9ACTN|nr:hypothetical protein C1I99_14220 [Micromonospora deserti]
MGPPHPEPVDGGELRVRLQRREHVVTLPISNDHRQSVYLRQSGRNRLTPRQRRRVEHKQGHIERLGGQARRPRR